jgi:hypothetical protein
MSPESDLSSGVLLSSQQQRTESLVEISTGIHNELNTTDPLSTLNSLSAFALRTDRWCTVYPVTGSAPLFQNEHRTTAWLGTHTHTLCRRQW